MKAGQRAKANSLKELDGNPGKRPINKKEPKIKKPIGCAPIWFDDEQKSMWDEIVSDVPKGLLKSVDSSTLQTYVVAYSKWKEATLAMNDAELVIMSPTGQVKANPLLSIQQQQGHIMRMCAGEMGFTPSARSRVSLDDDDNTTQEDNPFDVIGKGASSRAKPN